MLALIFFSSLFSFASFVSLLLPSFDSPPVTNQFVSASNFVVLNVFKIRHCLTFDPSSGFKTATATRTTIAWKVSRAVGPCTAVCCSAPDTAYLRHRCLHARLRMNFLLFMASIAPYRHNTSWTTTAVQSFLLAQKMPN
jgi:hypothetical protein